jgi:hypothetical protein
MKIVNLTSCNDWFFVHEGSQGQLIMYRIAAWGVNDSGEVYGLISQPEPREHPLRLVPAPALPGAYKHKEELTEEQLELALQMIPE